MTKKCVIIEELGTDISDGHDRFMLFLQGLKTRGKATVIVNHPVPMYFWQYIITYDEEVGGVLFIQTILDNANKEKLFIRFGHINVD